MMSVKYYEKLKEHKKKKQKLGRFHRKIWRFHRKIFKDNRKPVIIKRRRFSPQTKSTKINYRGSNTNKWICCRNTSAQIWQLLNWTWTMKFIMRSRFRKNLRWGLGFGQKSWYGLGFQILLHSPPLRFITFSHSETLF